MEEKKNKIIIFEGLDNTGKSTQIKKIIDNYSNSERSFHKVHYSSFGNNISNDDKQLYSKKLYRDMFELIDKSLLWDLNLILDRSHIGEYVYSPIYRNYNGGYVFDFEEHFLNRNLDDIQDQIFLLMFIDNPENLLKREDNLSLSNNSIEKIEKEISLFKEAFDQSLFKNKLIIDINNKNEQEVFELISQFINFK